MKIQLLSDLHTESGLYGLTNAGADVLVLAGDVAEGQYAIRWAGEAFSKPVVMVLGNHEHYGQFGEDFVDRLREEASAYPHLQLLEKDRVVIDGVRFLGTTLWANFELFGNPQQSADWAQEIMTDYAAIRTTPGGRKLTPEDTIRWHKASVAWLRDQLAIQHDGPTVVVTHHAPSARSLLDGHEEDPWSPAYASHLDDLVEASGAALWCHGHTHRSLDYRIGGTRVVCNPRGNPAGRLNRDFRHDLVIKIGCTIDRAVRPIVSEVRRRTKDEQ